MGISLTSFRGNWFVHSGNREVTVNRGQFRSKPVAAKILYKNF